MEQFKARIHRLRQAIPLHRLRASAMAFLLMLGSMFGVFTPVMQAYAAEPTITGTCHIEVDDLGANTGGSAPYTTFFVTMPDGQTYHGECIDHGSYIPLAGEYPFTGTWNGTGYDITVESQYYAATRENVYPDERINFDLYGPGYTQRVGKFTYMPYGHVQIRKVSADPSLTDGNSLYSLAGAEFTVYGQDGSVLGVLTMGEDGTTGSLELPAGTTVTIRETKAPEGFFPAAEQTVTIAAQETATVTFTDAPAYEPAGLMVTKHDGENGLPQGDATLEGAEFTIEYYDTLDYGDYDALKAAGITPLRTWVIATDDGGQASLDDAHLVSGDDLYRNTDGQAVLPRGTIVVYESHPSEGYLLNEGFHSFQKIQEQPMENTVTYQTPEAPEQVIRGGVEVHKHDQESDLNTPLGGASLDGTVFEVRTTSEQPVIVDGETYNKGEVVAILTVKDGYAATATDALPYGSYTLQETHVGEGYLLTDTTVYPFTIRENGVLVNPVTGDGHVHNQVKRADFGFSKKTGDSADILDYVPFKLTSLTTGEAHVIVTDANGYFNSASSWNPHTQNTNGNDWALGETGTIDSVLLDPTAGVWFGLTTENTMVETNDGLGALPYDTYRIEELRCTANEGYQLVDTTVTITRDGVVYDYGSLDDQPQPNVSITTNAYDPADGDNTIMAGNVEIADKVAYTGLTAGETYRLTAIIVDAETGEPVTVDDKPVTAIHEFTTQAADGYEIVETTLPATSLGGRTVTVFEELHRVSDGTLIAEHKDKDDVDQQLRVIAPQIGTTATDGADGDKTVTADTKATIVDTVEYTNLIPGEEYTLTGTLHVKRTNEDGSVTEESLLDRNGDPITAETTFTPDSPDGSVEAVFTFDATNLLDGTELVAFETLSHNGVEVAVHTDITDKGQTVTVENPKPAIGTTATDGADGDKTVTADMEATIVDTVEYTNLIPGEEYTLTSALYVKHVNEEGNVTEEALLDADGNPVSSKTTFTPETASGSVDVTFTFDASAIADGTELVAFETLFHNGEVIAVHADITDEGQTVTVENPTPEEPETPDTPDQPEPEQPTPEPDKPQGSTYGKTGVSTTPIAVGVILLIAAAGGAAFYAHLLHRRNGGQGHDE